MYTFTFRYFEDIYYKGIFSFGRNCIHLKHEFFYKKREPLEKLTLKTTGETITARVTLPEGEYFISAYQDINDNGKFDTNFIGFPKEPIGIANFIGTSMPGDFDKHKVLINTNNPEVPLTIIKI